MHNPSMSGGQGRGGSPGGAADYFTKYYMNGPDNVGNEWLGEGTRRLGISDMAMSKRNVQKVLEGYHPRTGERLVQNAGKDDRVFAIDCTLSAPKSVSVAYALADKSTARAIMDAHNRAGDTAMSYMEKTYVRTRTGQAGANKVQGKIIGFRSGHVTSRAGDPQLHIHNLVTGVTYGKGQTGAVDMKIILDNQKDVGRVYQQALGRELRAVGVKVERDPEQPFAIRVANIDPEICRHFSSRSEEIAARAEAEGLVNPSAEQKQYLAEWTRTPKPNEIDLIERSSTWKVQAAGQGYKLPDLKADMDRPWTRPVENVLDKVMGKAAEPADKDGETRTNVPTEVRNDPTETVKEPAAERDVPDFDFDR